MKNFANLLAVIALALGLSVVVLAASGRTTKGSLVGTWVKERVQVEDGSYPDDERLELSVVYQADGRFMWNAKRKSLPVAGEKPSEEVRWTDESASGTYSVEGAIITYNFDKPSPEALKRLPEFFSFWPSKRRGQHEFWFEDGRLHLKTSMTFIHLNPEKPKDVEQRDGEKN